MNARPDTPEKARKRLFQGSKPTFRPATEDDLRWLWAAYKIKPDGDDLTQDEFAQKASNALSSYSMVFIAEDKNNKFSQGNGPIGVVVSDYDGWNLEPHAEFFPWATHRNKVKTVVGFLMAQRFADNVGCIRIRSSQKNMDFYQRMRGYLPIRHGGKIAGGRPDGPEYIFYIRGNAKP